MSSKQKIENIINKIIIMIEVYINLISKRDVRFTAKNDYTIMYRNRKDNNQFCCVMNNFVFN